jgi:uncharacterized lipoprotein YehR (DUF1307 family)
MKKLFVLLVGVVALASCTENERARRFGGTEEITLKPNEVVLNVTWKQNEMWICTQDTITNVTYFREKSAWGIMEGTVILK